MGSLKCNRYLFGIGVLVTIALLGACEDRPRADRIFTGGHVLTMTEGTPEAEAFAVRDGLIAGVGSDAEILASFPEAERTSLDGRTVMPGIVESHVHLLSLGLGFIELNVEGSVSPEEVIEKVRERAAAAQPGQWITGWGWDEGAWAANYPGNEELNKASPDNPVWLRGLHGFAGWANSLALEAAGITVDTPDPENGRIVKDRKTGQPTGILTNQAQALLVRHIPPLPPEQMEKALSLAAEECLKFGLTTVHDANVSRAMLDGLHSLAAKGRLATRVQVMLDATDRELVDAYLAKRPEVDPGNQLTVRCVKIFADGALGSRGAAFFEPYSDAPDTRGLMTTSQEEIYRLTVRALKAGFQVAVHAIGDRAIRCTLDAYQQALRDVPEAKDPRLRIEHAQVAAPEDIPRFGKLGIISSMQPPHCTSDMSWAEARVGPERIKGAYAWRSFLDSGARLILNSDFPGETLDPFRGMYAAETRQTPDGKPEGGWHPEQRLTRAEVLRAYTVDSAWSGFEEASKGRIAPGMLADFIILSGDISKIPSESLLSLRVEETYLGGRRVYRRTEE